MEQSSIYNSYIRSHLIYSLLIWGPILKQSQVNTITKLQKKAVRYIENSSYNSPTGPLFKKYKILKFEDLIKLEVQKFGYNFVNKNLPKPILQLFNENSATHNYNTRGRYHPRSEQHKSKQYNDSFLVRVPYMWRNSTDSLRNAPSIGCLINRFKKQTLDSY